MSDRTVKAAIFQAAFTAFLSSASGGPVSHPDYRCGNRKTPNAPSQGTAAASSANPFVSLPVLQPRQLQRLRTCPPMEEQTQHRRFTAHGSVSLRRSPCFPAIRYQPNPFATNQFVPPENLPTAQPSQRRSLLGQTHRPTLPAAVLAPQQ